MNSASEGPDLSGTTLDERYALVRKLGTGAMGHVYEAQQIALDRRVAVKVLHPWLAEQRRYRKRFLREARAASRIKHPNVVEILDYGSAEAGSVYLVMELLHGRDLKAVLRERGRLPWPRARHFLLQAVAALREAHRQEVIHRDIKPANCYICTPPEPGLPERMKLLDFGIAKVETEPSASASMGNRGITQTGELVGTLAYMAPEFAEGRPASPHTDMYALGIMAYELVTGRVPFLGRNEFQVLACHLNEPPVRPCSLVPDLPLAVEALVLMMLAKKPQDRFTSMAELEQALLAIPGDADDATPIVVPRKHRESSGPKPAVRVHSGSAPQARASRAGSGPAVAARSPEPAPPPPPPSPARPPPVAREPVDDTPTLVGSSQGPDTEDFDERPRGTPPGPKRMEWGTVVTIVLLVALSVAAAISWYTRYQQAQQRDAVPAEPAR